MTWRAAISLALKGIRRQPGRAVLTVLAVTLAAALLTALLTIAGTAETRVLDELAKGGPLAGIKVAAATPDPAQIGRDDARPGDPKDLDEAALERIRALPEVREVVPVVAAKMLVISPTVSEKPGDGKGELTEPFVEEVVGVDVEQASILPVTVLAGRLPSPGSLTETVVTEGYLERFGIETTDADRVLGTVLQMGAARVEPPPFVLPGEEVRNIARGRWCKSQIVGVVAQDLGGGQIMVPTEQVVTAREWSLSGIESDEFGVSSSPYAGLFVVADGLDNVGKVRSQIVAIGYSTAAPENLIASVRRYLNVVEIVLTSVGVIALAVAALGITNAMLAAVRERRREIGVIKAIGGRDKDVRRVFLVEAGLLGFLGGVFGALAGWVIASVIGGIVNDYLVEQGLVAVQLLVPVPIMAGTVVGASLLAIAAGTFPAVRAARLPAREAVGAM